MLKATNKQTDQVTLVTIEQGIELLKTFDYTLEKADLFEFYETLPDNVQVLIHDEVQGYTACNELIEALKPLGYTCTYELDGCPMQLEKIEQPTDNTAELQEEQP